MSRDPAYILDILDSAKLIREFVGKTDRQAFEHNLMLQDAVIRRLTIIGEATKRLSETFKLNYPEIPWRQIAGMRDVVVHNYDQVQIDKVWEVIQQNIPTLIQQMELLAPSESTNTSSEEG